MECNNTVMDTEIIATFTTKINRLAKERQVNIEEINRTVAEMNAYIARTSSGTGAAAATRTNPNRNRT